MFRASGRHDAEAALTHEIRCQELIAARAVSKDKKDKSSKEKSQKPMLAAWDPSTDDRWQEILAIVQTEDESPMLVGKAGTQARRRPLLLYFPAQVDLGTQVILVEKQYPHRQCNNRKNVFIFQQGDYFFHRMWYI